MAEPVGDDESFTEGLAKARAALGGGARPRPRSVPDPEPEPVVEADLDDLDERDARIADLEVEVRALRAALARLHAEAGRALDL